jgi:hypothetical protein
MHQPVGPPMAVETLTDAVSVAAKLAAPVVAAATMSTTQIVPAAPRLPDAESVAPPEMEA